MRAVSTLHRSVADDRGAMLIYVSVGILALLSLATMVVDYGMFWLARGQAQNAADAAAHAGAVSLAYENRTAADVAALAATVGNANKVWGSEPSWANATPVVQRCPNIATGAPTCVQADVKQTLPTVFGRLVGVMSQPVWATAIAEARPGNTARCLKPWAVPDAWTEVTGNTTYDKYAFPPTAAAGTPLATPDLFTAPTSTSVGTGYQPARDLGSSLLLQQPTCGAPSPCRSTRQVPGFLMPVNLENTCTVAISYLQAIEGCSHPCSGLPVPGSSLSARIPTAALRTDTITGANALIGQDPGATYNAATKTVQNSCADPTHYTCLTPGLSESPRVVAIAAYNTTNFDDKVRGKTSATATYIGSVVVTNFLAVFIDHVDASGNVVTYLVKKQGDWVAATPTVSGDSAFTSKVLIVR